MEPLSYSTWESFKTAISRAQDACLQTGQGVEGQFRDATKLIIISKEGQRAVDAFLLTRYACYLIAQNGVPRKAEIAAAQSYFAIQTRKQEVWEQRSIENKRLEEREKLRETESNSKKSPPKIVRLEQLPSGNL